MLLFKPLIQNVEFFESSQTHLEKLFLVNSVQTNIEDSIKYFDIYRGVPSHASRHY